MAVSWRDALKRAAASGSDAPVATPLAVAPAAIDPGAASPRLQALLDERRRMEATMATLTGQDPAADPRYAVTPLGQRRAELDRWGQVRDAARPTAPAEPVRPAAMPSAVPDRAVSDRSAPDRSIAGRMLQALASARGTPALRTTAGETPGGTPTRADVFAALRDAARGDASGLTDKAFARFDAPKPLRGDDALARAKKAIPDDWRDRARHMIPELGETSGYAKRARELLTVAVGSVDELTEKAERVRDTLRDARELKQADDAGDDARRDRALDRLKARRQEGA